MYGIGVWCREIVPGDGALLPDSKTPSEDLPLESEPVLDHVQLSKCQNSEREQSVESV